MAITPKPFFVNLEPITILGIKTYQPQIFRIYTGKNDRELHFVAVAEKVGGTALGTIFEKSQHKWIGKVGMPTGFFRNDPATVRSRTKKEINSNTISEKLAYDLYQELGRGLFLVPKTRLSKQSIMDQFTLTHGLAVAWISQGIQDSLRIMARYMEGYHDFAKAQTSDEGHPIAFMAYIKKYHRPPETLLTPEGKSVPLKGMMSLIAVGRCLADADVLGGTGGNAGFIWAEDAQGIQAAQAVKIDPGESFKFIKDPEERVSMNWVINTQQNLGHPDRHLNDLRDLQTSTQNQETLIHWTALTPSQQEEFLATLFNCIRYLHSKEVLHFLFYREGAFNRSETELIPEVIAETLETQMQAWMKQQQGIYLDDLRQFKESHPDQLIRVHYIDKWGELTLPMADERFPIRELFTNLRIVKEEKEEEMDSPLGTFEVQARSDQLETDSSIDSWIHLGSGTRFLKLEELFDPIQGKKPAKLLLIGRAGIGKSTLCQKIAHDWASGRLWNDQFDVIYWLPLRELNAKELSTDNLDLFLAEALSQLIFKGEVEIKQILDFIQQNRQRSLILLDGHDETAPHLKDVVAKLLQEKDLKILLTSRPGTTETLHPYLDLRVENIGFSDDQIETYATHFFSRSKAKKDPRPFLQMLRANKSLFELAHIPLQLQMLCSLWEQKKEGFASHLTGLYKQMTDQLLRWNAKKFKLSDPQEILLLLGKIAHQGLLTHELLIPKQMIEAALKGTPYTKEDLLATGLLKESAEGSSYAFLHLSFQEYLIAHTIASQSPEQQKKFILKYRNNPSYHLTLTFLCGILFQSNPKSIPFFFEALYEPPLRQRPKEILKLSFRCLNECTDGLEELPPFNRYLAQNIPALEILVEDTDFYKQTHALKYLYAKNPSLMLQADKRGFFPFFWTCFVGNLELAKWLHEKDPSLLGKFSKDGWTPLHAAAEGGHVPMAQWLCSQDPSLLGKFKQDGWTPLHSAALKGHVPMAQWLCSQDPSLLGKFMQDGWTPLYAAAQEGHVPMAQWLCSQDPSLLGKFRQDGWTPLHVAALKGHVPMAQWLCSQDPSLLGKFRQDGFTPLHSAALKGHVPMAQWLCSQDPSLLGKFMQDGQTPLHSAALKGHVPMAQWLCSQDPSLLGKFMQDGWTPLHSAAQEGHVPMAQWLCSQDPSLLGKFRQDGWTPLHAAAQEGHVPMAQWLCSQDPSLLGKFMQDGQTPLHVAALKGHVPMAQWLCSQDPSLLGKFMQDGWTPLHSAAQEGHLPMAQWLCSQDPSLLGKFKQDGWTPLHAAALKGHVPMAQWLCSQDPSLLGKFKQDGWTPLHAAALKGHVPMAQWLCSQDPSLLGKFRQDGVTPLHAAAQEGHVPMAQWLCSQDPSLLGKFMQGGWTPLHAAAQEGHVPMAQWLCSQDPSLLGKFKQDGWTPLHAAAQEGHLPMAQWLCSQDPHQPFVRVNKEPPFMVATRYRQNEVANWLRENFPKGTKDSCTLS